VAKTGVSVNVVKVGSVPGVLRTEWKLDRFYTRFADAGGVPVLASRKVAPGALAVAVGIVTGMTARRPELLASLVASRIRVAVIGKTELATDVPEHAEMRRDGLYWNRRGRGYGPQPNRPAVSCGEENLLRLRGDPWHGENILVHEFAHALHDFALKKIDPRFDGRLYATYTAALRAGLWPRTYAETDWAEYWAEGVQSYFDANMFRWVPDGVHNGIDTRVKLRRYDPPLFRLIDTALRSPPWSWLRVTEPARVVSAGRLRSLPLDRR
jgi:hypothetical protein